VSTVGLRSFVRWIGTQSWLRLGLRRRIVGWFYPNGKAQGFEFEVPFHGYRYRGNTGVSQEWHVYFFGGYELKEVAFMRDLLGKGMPGSAVLDVGANLGGHSLAIANVAKKIDAFEPFHPLAAAIEKRIELNGLKNIELHRFGLGLQKEKREYYLDPNSHNSGTGSFLPEHMNAPSQGQMSLERGDDWAGERKVDFIKVDVEGFEAYVLGGMPELLRKNAPIIMLEVTDTSWKLFEANGGLNKIIPGRWDIYEIQNPSYVMGVFQTNKYRLSPVKQLQPGPASFNILIVPEGRRAAVEGLL
jgi:FkbM family methyltransferase